MKTCTKCKAEKLETAFSKDSTRKDLLNPHCKSCNAAYRAENREAIAQYKRSWNIENAVAVKAKKKLYAQDNAAIIAEYKKRWSHENKDRLSMQKREWKLINPEKVKSGNAAYRASNKDSIKEKGRRYYLSRREVLSERQKAYRISNPNPEADAAKNHRRRALKKGAKGSHTAADIRAIFSRQRGLCANCRIALIKSGNGRYHVDHIQPLSAGGSDCKYNIQCLCPACNLRKNAKDPFAWANENGRLL